VYWTIISRQYLSNGRAFGTVVVCPSVRPSVVVVINECTLANG